MSVPSYREELVSQIPALQLLTHLGYDYLTPTEALSLRDNKRRTVILTGVLEDWLRRNNAITFKGQSYDFSDANIREAIRRLTEYQYDGLVSTNEKISELLTLGTSLTQTISGDTKSFSLRYIDWWNPDNNVYHVTDEFTVERRRSHETRRPDIVCFVNGIPLVVIECKRPDKDYHGSKSYEEAISQMIRNQHDDEIPHLFVYSQLLMAVSTNNALYATTGTKKEFWSVWKEENEEDHEVNTDHLINQPLTEEQKARLYDWRKDAHWIRHEFDQKGERLPTEQDRAIVSLLSPGRLLELAYQFIVYDGGVKKIARHQQYFAVQATIDRVAHINPQGERTGGVIWHTTGSGKSLTMVMLAKALALHPEIPNPRVVLVTDRVNLDDQIYGTFKACGKSVEQAQSGRHLIDLIQSGRVDIIATVINKFETVAREYVEDINHNIFVLVDEGHRSQYGTIHAKMRKVFKRACYIGFTGTPLTRQEKNTARQFGDFIHKYSMRQAVEDGTVVPLLYEGRMVDLEVDKTQIDKWFERRTLDLTDEQKANLKHKMSQAKEISKVDQRIQEIAWDLARHYKRNFKRTGFKAQFATASKEMAIKYKRCLDDGGLVTTEVVISPPDTREGHEEVDSSTLPLVQEFWRRMMDRYGNEENYNRETLRSFHDQEGVEILIVVDKLLVGFDEPRNTVLYIDKPLKEHGILQAIARVNRLFGSKDFGYVIDYRGVLGELNEAMQIYNALEEYDIEDVAGTITDVASEIEKLPQLHSDLWAVFNPVENKNDSEAMERFLGPEDTRQRFYDALTAYARSLKVALSTVSFYEIVPEGRINTYKHDLQFFHNLRMSVKMRYAEIIDYKEYEQKIHKLLSDHISAHGTRPITQLVDVFDEEAFEREIERVEGAAAKADTIAHRLKRTITEKMEQDPAFYRKFSDLIDETIKAYYQGRIEEIEYLERVTDAMEQVRSGYDRSQPAKLRRYKHSSAYYGAIHDTLTQHDLGGSTSEQDETIADLAIQIEIKIEARKIRDWANNPDVENAISNDLEDYLYDLKDQYGIALSAAEMDLIIDNIIDVARKRDNL